MTHLLPCRPLALTAFLLWAALSAYPQVTLTGAIQLSTDANGNATSQRWNTLGAPADTLGMWDLWVALDPNATMPVNGPDDAQAGIHIPLTVGQTNTYYIFAQPNGGYSFDGLNLFFDGNNSTPGISVFGAIDSSSFRPNGGSTWTLAGVSVPGSGTAFYSANGVTVILNGYNWNNPATAPGDVCQSYAFSPASGNVLSYFGAFTLQVWPAAALSLSPTGGPPGTSVTITGSGFSPEEIVDIHVNGTGGPPLAFPVTDASGGFTTTARELQAPYGPVNIDAVGRESGKLGAASLFVTAAMAGVPRTGSPGDTITANGFGFGAGETVDIYWADPRQLLGTTTANGKGSGALTFTIPANAPDGPNALQGIGQTTGAHGFGEVLVK
jgi:hypothetical protein